MEIVVTGRNAEISERFTETVETKLSKVEQLAPKAQRIEVELTHEPNPRQSETSDRVEITVRDRGPVVRAEARSSDRYGALDLATGKLLERLRRVRDRQKDRHRPRSRGRRQMEPVPAEAIVPLPQSNGVPEAAGDAIAPDVRSAPTQPGEAIETQLGDSPVLVRHKLHDAEPMTVDQALYEMELVGHPFFLFIDADTGQPCAVYHRRGYTYGVIRLNTVVAGSEGLLSQDSQAHSTVERDPASILG
ncbi:ribosome hibernation-promoting factor, HPF/YfiA family [Bogoriella caseilytica]|uniref:Ribosome hibernation promoting factor n=1 Tax=Bogoriella caseilytica TaxID=56055 RepID=A0A3N2BEV1_9MICO|nr:ribosome-associated translation inhibitor RaiA [Bogoriella caseilytica]ROR73745.1 ribosomal subunit interface protein [Bogoriella caseilytica]